MCVCVCVCGGGGGGGGGGGERLDTCFKKQSPECPKLHLKIVIRY